MSFDPELEAEVFSGITHTTAMGLTHESECCVFLLCLFVNRMWRQSTGQQRQLFLSWIPQWILGVHALHLENLGDTWREGKNLRKSNIQNKLVPLCDFLLVHLILNSRPPSASIV